MNYQFRPLTWTGALTPVGARKNATFKATYPATLGLLFREAEKLGARDLVLQVDISERDIRTDGLPRAAAKYGSNPGVIVSFDSAHGPLRYQTDAFTEWQDNLRAIALSLEALRAVDRYGISKRGEQYTGWRAIEAGDSFGTPERALEWMRAFYAADRGWSADEVAALAPGQLYRQLAKMLHPDAGGGEADWDRLDNARQLLITAGRL
jgi:hypothetical protein